MQTSELHIFFNFRISFVFISNKTQKVLKQSEKNERINNFQHSMSEAKKKSLHCRLCLLDCDSSFCMCIIALLFLVNGSKAFFIVWRKTKQKEKKIDFMVCDSCFAALLCVCLSFFRKRNILCTFLCLLLLLFCRLPKFFFFLDISLWISFFE